jgi:predicted Zn-dependent protease
MEYRLGTSKDVSNPLSLANGSIAVANLPSIVSILSLLAFAAVSIGDVHADQTEGSLKDAESAYAEKYRAESGLEVEETFAGYLNVLSEQRKHSEVYALVLAHLEKYPFSYAARISLARLRLQEQRYDDAISEIRRIRNLKQETSESHFTLAEAYSAKGQNAEALRELDTALSKNPVNFNARFFRAQLNLQRRDFKLALEDGLYLGNLAPNNSRALLIQGTAHFGLKDKPRLLQTLRKLAALPPASMSPETALAVADLYFGVADLRGAKDYVEKLKATPYWDVGLALRLAKVLAALNERVAAEAELQWILAREPGNDLAAYEYVKIQQDASDYEGAARFLQGFNQKYPDRAWAALAYSKGLQLIDRLDEAEAVLKPVSQSKDYGEEVALESIKIRLRRGDLRGALKSLQVAEAQYPRSAAIKRLFADALNRVGSRDLATSKANQARDLSSRLPASVPVGGAIE